MSDSKLARPPERQQKAVRATHIRLRAHLSLRNRDPSGSLPRLLQMLLLLLLLLDPHLSTLRRRREGSHSPHLRHNGSLQRQRRPRKKQAVSEQFSDGRRFRFARDGGQRLDSTRLDSDSDSRIPPVRASRDSSSLVQSPTWPPETQARPLLHSPPQLQRLLLLLHPSTAMTAEEEEEGAEVHRVGKDRLDRSRRLAAVVVVVGGGVGAEAALAPAVGTLTKAAAAAGRSQSAEMRRKKSSAAPLLLLLPVLLLRS